jgi:uncharacterized cupredoxin-like copper-binding protein
MKRSRIGFTVAVLGLAVATGALGHGDERQGADGKRPPSGHAAALGVPGDAGDVGRSIMVEMSDAMRFRPDRVRVRRGETIRFVVRNTGRLTHEMVLGTMEELAEHAERMRKDPDMEHADPNQISVEPGSTGELIWRFTRVGIYHFGCLRPGHFEAGMVGKVVVVREAD